MPDLCLQRTRIAGVAAAVPERFVPVADSIPQFGEEAIKKFSLATGIERRPVGNNGLCSSDLCFAAAEELLSQLQWNRETIDALVFVSQTPDYILPATSCVLHQRLGLSPTCAAWDVNLGCSGYPYGILAASQLIEFGSAKRTLLLVGDTVNRVVSSTDPGTAMLFGDAGTATALEFAADAPQMRGTFGTDGSGYQHLIVPSGGFRQPAVGNRAAQLSMNGAEVFAFTLREVPKLVRHAMENAQWTMDDVDYVIFHQANEFMLKHLGSRLRIPSEKLVLSLQEYGNTSCASIPVAMVDRLRKDLNQRSTKLLVVGFGVGFSWGAFSLTTQPMAVPEMIRVPLTAGSTADGVCYEKSA